MYVCTPLCAYIASIAGRHLLPLLLLRRRGLPQKGGQLAALRAQIMLLQEGCQTNRMYCMLLRPAVSAVGVCVRWGMCTRGLCWTVTRGVLFTWPDGGCHCSLESMALLHPGQLLATESLQLPTQGMRCCSQHARQRNTKPLRSKCQVTLDHACRTVINVLTARAGTGNSL